MTSRGFALFVAVATLGSFPLASWATPASDKLFPATTKAYVSVPSAERLETKWNATQLGKMLQDPAVQPFAEDLKQQVLAKLDESSVRLGISWAELVEVARGEIALAILQPGNAPATHAALGIVDVTGNEEAAKALLAKIGADLVKEHAAKPSNVTIAGKTAVRYALPAQEGVHSARDLFYLIDDGTLIASDHAKELEAMLGRWKTGAGAIDAHPPYVATMTRVAAAGGSHDAKWFVDPLGYAEIARELDPNYRRRKNDLVSILRKQGFDAIQGVGGVVELGLPTFDVQHRTYVFAPGSKEGARFKLAARMLEFPTASKLEPLPFVPDDVSLNADFLWNVKNAFESSKTLIDAFAEDQIFDSVLESLKKDPLGPQIDLRKELVAHLGTRVVVFSDVVQPVTPNSERLAAAIELTDAAAVQAAVDKAMKKDPNAVEEKVGGQSVWRIQNEEEDPSLKAPKIEDPGFGGFGGDDDGEDEEEEEREKLFTAWCVTVWKGYLLVSSDFTLMQQILEAKQGKLADAADFRAVTVALDQLGPGAESARIFNRNSESFRSTWELVRAGKMPESQTLLGKLLNRGLGPKEKGVLRKQEIDGSKMPPFDAVQKYFAPSGARVLTDANGWYVTGGVLSVQAAGGQAAAVADAAANE